MEIEGWTVIFYDKFAGVHNYDNPYTNNISLEFLFGSDYQQLTGIDAINEFNKFNNVGIDRIPNDLDTNLYQIIMFITTYDNNINNIAKYTCVSINNNLLKEYVMNKTAIPNYNLLLNACRYHNSYNKKYINKNNLLNNIDAITNDMITTIINTTGDITDPMIENPDFLTCQLYDYQKRSIYWMLQKEKEKKKIIFNINDEIILGDIFFDTMKQIFTSSLDRKSITFSGGSLIDEVGLGKTVQMTSLALLNQASFDSLSYIKPDINKLCSRANLILCPNQLCGQWKRELEKMVKENYNLKIIPFITKIQFDKYTYQDLIDADFVIVSYNYFDNKAFLNKWMNQISNNKSYHKIVYNFNLPNVKNLFNKLGQEILKDPVQYLFKTDPLIPLIHWHRIIIDEFHEIYTVPKYSYMMNLLPILESTYKWCVTGTPFDKSGTCLLKMLDYITNYSNPYDARILSNNLIVDYLKNNFFRRNTKKSVSSEYQLKPIKESVIWLKFTHTERMIYNAYLANVKNDKFSIFLRQLCCHPKLAEETKDILSNCKTLDDIEKMMVLHYEKAMNKAQDVVDYLNYRIKLTEIKIKQITFKRQKRFLIQIGYNAEIKKEDIEIPQNLSIYDKQIDQTMDMNMNMNIDLNIIDDELEEVIAKPTGKKIIVSDENQEVIQRLIKNLLENNKSKAINNLRNYIDEINLKLNDALEDLDGKKTTFNFYKNVFNRIKKTFKDNINNQDEVNEDNETCGICLSEIPENDIGITKCGHMFCHTCIKSIISKECPYCRKILHNDGIFLISYEKEKKNEANKDLENKLSLINEVGTKLANIIYYLKGNDNHVIVFSQWDDLLRKFGSILDNYGIKNVFCRGNVWQRDKAIRLFNSDNNIRVIMLSSESAASGTNLTKANKVIIMDPVIGSYEYRKNTEGQAIGRAHRMGQNNEVEVLRFIIKDTIEEDIYNENKKEDTKYITNIKIFETTDDDITLSKDKLNELNTSFDKSKIKIKQKK